MTSTPNAGAAAGRQPLSQTERAESALRQLGLAAVRVRQHGDMARVELPTEDLVRAVTDPLRGQMHDAVRQVGFRFVTVDLAEIGPDAVTGMDPRQSGG